LDAFASAQFKNEYVDLQIAGEIAGVAGRRFPRPAVVRDKSLHSDTGTPMTDSTPRRRRAPHGMAERTCHALWDEGDSPRLSPGRPRRRRLLPFLP